MTAREYYARYYILHKDEKYRNACPDCHGLKSKAAKRCESCARLAHARGRPRGAARFKNVKPKTNCPYCDAELRPLVWHGLGFKKCPECGLETTDVELKRMALEEVA